jgi:predicted RNA methylase
MKLRSLLSFAGPASVIDSCVGQGTALQLITSEAPARRYGVELDAERARIASANGVETILGNAFDANARPESFSLPYMNPPYDSEIGSIAIRRMEAVFPTMAEVEEAMIAAVYEKSNRRPLEAARLLGIGKTTVYRKLRAMGDAAGLDARSCVRTFEDVDGGQAAHQ